jgi:uncharacterized phage protein (TIGR01671 family)
MRQILFRGFNRKNNVWLYGFYLQNRKAHFVAPDEFATGKTWDDYEIDPETLGQFINRKDKKGNDIYDGDILFVEFSDGSSSYSLIGWNEKQMCWGCMDRYAYQSSIEVCDFAEFNDYVLKAYLREALICEVVGNVHDNPDLLKTTD